MNEIIEIMTRDGEIGIDDIKKIIPYDDPFLFIDKIISMDSSKIVATKTVTGDESFFRGHFVGFPIMPGALTVEGMGQAGTLLIRSNLQNHEDKDVLAYKLKEVKFTAPIYPPAEIKFEVSMIALDERGAVLQGKTFLKDRIVAEALFVLAIVNRQEFRKKSI